MPSARPYAAYCDAVAAVVGGYTGKTGLPGHHQRQAEMDVWHRMALSAVHEMEWDSFSEEQWEYVIRELETWAFRARKLARIEKDTQCVQFMKPMKPEEYRTEIGLPSHPSTVHDLDPFLRNNPALNRELSNHRRNYGWTSDHQEQTGHRGSISEHLLQHLTPDEERRLRGGGEEHALGKDGRRRRFEPLGRGRGRVAVFAV